MLVLGAGSGVLALLAARAGARRVTAVERSRMLFRMAQQTLAANADAPGAENIRIIARSLQGIGVHGDLPSACPHPQGPHHSVSQGRASCVLPTVERLALCRSSQCNKTVSCPFPPPLVAVRWELEGLGLHPRSSGKWDASGGGNEGVSAGEPLPPDVQKAVDEEAERLPTADAEKRESAAAAAARIADVAALLPERADVLVTDLLDHRHAACSPPMGAAEARAKFSADD